MDFGTASEETVGEADYQPNNPDSLLESRAGSDEEGEGKRGAEADW